MEAIQEHQDDSSLKRERETERQREREREKLSWLVETPEEKKNAIGTSYENSISTVVEEHFSSD